AADGAWEVPPTFPDDCDLLRDTIRETGARLVVLDPFLAFLSAGVSKLSDQWVRRALAPLAQVADETRAALVLVRHLTNGARGRGIADRTLERAKSQVHAVSEHRWEASKNVWYWRLPNPEETNNILTELWSENRGPRTPDP